MNCGGLVGEDGSSLITLLTPLPPLRSKSSNVTSAAVDAFVTATPVWRSGVAEASTYIRNAVPRFDGAAASVTVNAPFLNVKRVNALGAAPPPVGTTRTEPRTSGPVSRNRCELRAASEYGAKFAAVPFTF